MAKNRITELKLKLKQDTLDQLRLNQHNEQLELEETHIMEFNNFNQNWDKTMNDFQAHSQNLLKALEEKQNRELEDLRNTLEKKLPQEFKPSPEFLNLQKIQLNLAKQARYSDAHQV